MYIPDWTTFWVAWPLAHAWTSGAGRYGRAATALRDNAAGVMSMAGLGNPSWSSLRSAPHDVLSFESPDLLRIFAYHYFRCNSVSTNHEQPV